MTESTEVLIVGAGPVGLTLALDLAQRGVRGLLVEMKAGPLRLPKMERTNPRTMEIFRRLGVHEAVRAHGLPPDCAMDVYMVSSLDRPPLKRIEYPSVNETRARIAASNDGTEAREPYQLISQYTLEPLLIERLKSLPSVEARFRTELTALEQDADGVRATLRDLESGETYQVAAKYLVGADGAGSRVRKLTGIQMEGQTDLGTVTNVFFRCEDFFEKSVVPQGRHYSYAGISTTGGSAGSMIVQDDIKHFAYHTAAPPETDMAALIREITGLDIQPEILHVGPWSQNMLVAREHSRGRVFLAGDANHIYIPAGGLGMNTGIVDAINLGWKLAAVVQGWGGPGLLDSYDAERNPTARRTIGFVAHAVEGATLSRQGFTALAMEDTDEGRAALEAWLARSVPLLRRVYDMVGADLGYRYASPVIAEEDGEPPADDAYRYQPSTFPGVHLPHLWLGPDDALYDRLGAGFNLLKLGQADTRVLEAAFRELGAPLQVLSLDSDAARTVYGRDLILVRPDLHVAWRGDRLPADPKGLAAKVTGR